MPRRGVGGSPIWRLRPPPSLNQGRQLNRAFVRYPMFVQTIMRRSRFAEHQVVGTLKFADSGVPVKDLCRELGTSSAPY